MRSRELTRQAQSLKALVAKTETATGGDIEMQSHWAKYLCVLVAGFLENALTEVYRDFCKRAASERVADYASKALSQVQNPKTKRFIEIASAFDKAWGRDLEQFVEDGGRKDAIDSIMNNRHQIAHGRSSGITVARVKTYFEKAIDVIEYIENHHTKPEPNAPRPRIAVR